MCVSRMLTQSNIQALRIPGSGGADQLLARRCAQWVQPADNRVAATQAKGLARQLLGTLCAAWLQQQDAFAIESGVP